MNKEENKTKVKITPCLWFDDQAEEAVDFYTSIFDEAEKGRVSYYGKEGREIHGKPEGSVLTVEFQLAGLSLIALNGGPNFKFNPSVSFFVRCGSVKQLDDLWSSLLPGSADGSVLMPLQEYPFSKRYGWLQDKYGLSWQLMLSDVQDSKQEINPSLLFVGEQAGKARDAIAFYTSIFDNSHIEVIADYESGEEPNIEGHIKFASFTLEGQKFSAMDSSLEHSFSFNEAVSFEISCENQEQVDKFWDRLSFVPEAEQCGWLKDKYGVSWQVTPHILTELINDPDPEKSGRVMEAMLKMKKIDIEGILQAYQPTVNY